ncbi:hypothetical protein BN341_8780 [Helicobacter heilmannii ASB1.4]|uniref:Uncharacterized protein n=1 Tax=Helicobacter heilmannii TaxID=35817 RepID=A0A0K2YDG5_HELHE|nr:hypothetical protein BN341_8780 [Helicobacter heilmannii ASB1.4]CRI35045.1 hypothetical protein HHE01_00430 [Helicobacter heilmannii]
MFIFMCADLVLVAGTPSPAGFVRVFGAKTPVRCFCTKAGFFSNSWSKLAKLFAAKSSCEVEPSSLSKVESTTLNILESTGLNLFKFPAGGNNPDFWGVVFFNSLKKARPFSLFRNPPPFCSCASCGFCAWGFVSSRICGSWWGSLNKNAYSSVSWPEATRMRAISSTPATTSSLMYFQRVRLESLSVLQRCLVFGRQLLGKDLRNKSTPILCTLKLQFWMMLLETRVKGSLVLTLIIIANSCDLCARD